MKFEMWSVWHFVLMLSPIVAIIVLYFALRKQSYKTRYIVGVVIGCVSLAILIMRNIDIMVRNGFDPEIIPLQVCHLGNIMVFISLVFKSKIATSIAWTLNLLAAYASLIFADSLANYTNVGSIRAQAYIWGTYVHCDWCSLCCSSQNCSHRFQVFFDWTWSVGDISHSSHHFEFIF